MITRLYVIRHGETEANVMDLLQGVSDTPLTERGIEQAAALGRRLARERIDIAFSSDLPRALTTTELALGLHEVPIVHTERLRERNWGSFELRPVADYKALQEETRGELIPNGVESLDQLEARVRAFLGWLIVEHAGKSILLSSHQAFCRMVTKILSGASTADWGSIRHDNAALSIFEVDNELAGRPLLLSCKSHLAIDQ